MDNQLTIKEFLRVFDHIRSIGKPLDSKFLLEDIYACMTMTVTPAGLIIEM